MSVIDKFLNKFGYEKGKAQELYSGNSDGYSSMFGTPQPENYHRYLNSYADTAWVYACVYLIANAIAGLNYKIYKDKVTQSGVEPVEVFNKNLHELFTKTYIGNKTNRNDDNTNFYNIEEFTYASVELTGNSYWLLDEMNNENSQPQSLNRLISSRVKIVAGKDKLIDKYIYVVGTKKVEYEPYEILHFKAMSVDNMLYGQSSVSAGRDSIETNKKAIETNLKIFANGAKLDGALSTESTLTDKTFQRLLKQVNQKYQGWKNSHKMMLLEQGLKYNSMTATMQELEYIEGLKLTREEICAVFGVPPLLVGILDKASYANYKESQKIFWQNTIIPKLRKYEAVLTRIVKMYEPEAYFKFDISNIEALKADLKLKADTAKIFWSMGIPLNDIIQKMELPFAQVKGGDTGYIPFGVMAIGSEREKPVVEEDEKSVSKGFSEEKKLNIWKQFDTLTTRISKEYLKIIDKYFTGQEKRVLTKLNTLKTVKISEEELEDLFGANWREEIEEWAKVSKEVHEIALDSNAKREIVNYGFDITFDVKNPLSQKWLDTYSLDKSKEVMDTQKDAIKDTLLEGFSNGESIQDLSKRIKDVYTPFKNAGWKAKRISRTEVIAASNEGALESYKQAGIEKKGWLVQRAGEPRDTHIAAGNKYENKGIDINKNFAVGSGSGAAPGQIGIAEEDCNCRCSVIAIINEEA